MKVSVTITMSKHDVVNTILKLNETTTDFLHLDVMDGNFVEKILHPFDEVKTFIRHNKKPLDIHLMVENNKKHIKQFAKLKPEYITFHYETKEDIMELIYYIRLFNIKAGLSIKPKTTIEEIKEYLPYLDQVLVMSVEPGLGGQKFMEEIIPKITELKKIREKHNYNYLISVDGGINEETSKLLKDADVLSVGSFVCMNDNYQEQIDKLKNR